MQIRWPTAATEDLFRIVEYIRRENVSAAQRVAKAICFQSPLARRFLANS